MNKTILKSWGPLVLSLLAVVCLSTACPSGGPGGNGGEGEGEGTLSCDLENPCGDGMMCSGVVEGESFCVRGVTLRGQVMDSADSSPIAGALVQAIDVNGTPAGTPGASNEMGMYEITVPRLQDVDGELLEAVYTLLAQATGYQEFPTPIRPALPIDVNDAVEVPIPPPEETGTVKGETVGPTRLVVENSLTTIALIALPGDSSLLGSISGSILADANAGILVVAEGESGSFTGFSDSSGNFKIFNTPAGDYMVNGYAAGVQLEANIATVEESTETTEVNLLASENPLNSLSGSVQIVNAPGGLLTSVILALESTFQEASGRGSVPPGLRVGEINGGFLIEGIPDGRYVVLAAFENDFLVRDPDLNISGTQTLVLDLPDPVLGNDIAISDGFKITEALAVVTPGADGPEEVFTPEPLFEWADDSSEDGYEIRVIDSFGNEIWTTEIGTVSGSETVTLEYAGPPLERGIFYQFKVLSFRERVSGRNPISTTEDLTGVFYYLGSPEPETP